VRFNVDIAFGKCGSVLGPDSQNDRLWNHARQTWVAP
jgi:hypothetical protein